MAKGTALVKSRERYKKLITAFPEREEFYLEQIADINQQIVTMGVCRRCGRPLKSDEALELGYGKECLNKAMEAEATTE